MNTVSVAALEWIGLTKNAATGLYERFINRPDPQQNPDSILDYVRALSGRLTTEPLRSMNPDEAMTQIGISAPTRRRILDPAFTSLFWTETLSFWVEDTLYINYLTLEKLHRRLKSRANHKRQRLESSSEATAALSINSDDCEFPKTYVAVGTMPNALQDHLVLWKGTASEEMMERGWIQPDGSLKMEAIASRGGGDFSYLNPAWYWTEEQETAELYRCYAARRCPTSETWLIRIQIPTKFINTLGKEQLWYGHDWKQYVWCCKKGDAPPEVFDHLWDGRTDVIKGHICTGVSAPIARIQREDVQTKITEDSVLEIGNKKCTQVVFMALKSVRDLGRAIKGNVHVEVHKAERKEDED